MLENVRGLTVGRHRQLLDEVTVEVQSAGYDVSLPWQVLNARDYGVPQDRQRLFLLGAKGVPAPRYPLPAILTPSPTCEDALDDLPNADDFDELISSDTVRVAQNTSGLSAYAKAMKCLTNDAWHHGHVRRWDPQLLTASRRTDHTDISRGRFRATTPGTVEPISRFYKLSANGVSNTLRAGTDSARGAFTSPRPIHYRYDRCVTVREMARLHGFPDWFRFHVTKWHGARQIGNSVPPPLARSVAESVREALAVAPTVPHGSMPLGATSLLQMDMTEAAAHWGVDVPIGKRDRKSGATKRKQQDIERERAAITAGDSTESETAGRGAPPALPRRGRCRAPDPAARRGIRPRRATARGRSRSRVPRGSRSTR